MMKKNSPMLLLLLLGELPAAYGVIAGKRAEKQDWFVLLTRVEGADAGEIGRVQCGGTLVARDMVLTAAHCFDQRLNPNGLPAKAPDTAWVGRQAMCSSYGSGDIGKAFDIDSHYFPKSYNYTDEYNLHDLALLKLKEQDPACPDRGVFADNNVFATYGESDMTISYNNLRLYGFGRTTGIDSPTTGELQVQVTNYDATSLDCGYWAGKGFNTTYQLCVNPLISCYGDSGGGLVFPLDTGIYDVVGIASYMQVDSFDKYYCNQQGDRVADVYTRVATYRQSIFETICAHSSYPPSDCDTANIRDEDLIMIGTELDVPGTLERLAWTALRRAGRFFRGEWFNY